MCSVHSAKDAFFASLFVIQHLPAKTPWQLALVTVMHFAEGFSDW